MNPELHDRAKRLMAADLVEGIPTADREWLASHLSSCEICSKEANGLNVVVRSIRTTNITAPAGVVHRTRLAMQLHAEHKQAKRERAVALSIAIAVSIAWAIVTTPYSWSAFEWVGQQLGVPDVVWEAGFFMWWFLPATIASALAAWCRVSDRKVSLEWRAL